MDQATINEINLMKAHAAIIISKADEILKKLDRQQTRKSRSGMTPEREAAAIARLRKKMYRQPTKK